MAAQQEKKVPSQEVRSIDKIVRYKLESAALWNTAVWQRCHFPEHVLMQHPQLERCSNLQQCRQDTANTRKLLQHHLELLSFSSLRASNWFWQVILHTPTEPSSTSSTSKIIYILAGCTWNLSALNYTKSLGASRHRARCSITPVIRKQLKLRCRHIRDWQ